MNSSLLPWAALWLLTAAAVAQPTAPADPADAKAPVRPLSYPSSLQRYKPLTDAEIGDWRAANRRVAPPAAASAPASVPAPAPTHSHHH